MKPALLVLPLTALMLSGCVSLSRSETVQPISAADAAGGRIETIALRRGGDLKLTPGFDDLFRARVKAKTDACATGDRPLRLEASLERFDKANPAMTAIVAGANVMRGEARLVDIRTGKTVGSYKIGKTIVGGRFAVIVMAEAEEQLSDAFGEELCEKAFAKAAN